MSEDPRWTLQATEPGQQRPDSRRVLKETAELLWPSAERIEFVRAGWRRPPNTRDLLMLPPGSWRRILAPVTPLRAAAASFRRNDSRQSVKERAKRVTLRAALLSGASQTLSRERLRLHLPAGAAAGRDIEELLSEALGRPVLVCVAIGSLRPNRKPVLQLVGPDGRCLGFAKLARNELTGDLVRRETAALHLLGGLPLRTLAVPDVLADTTWRGQPLLVMSPVLSRPGRGAPPLEAMRELADATGRSTQPLRQTAWWSTQVRDASPDLGPVLDRVAQRYGDVPVDTAGSHGDWTEWNNGRLPDGRIGVWDWERFESGVPVGLDLTHWLVQGALRDRLTGWRTATNVSLPQLRTGLPVLGVAAEQAELLLELYLINLHVRYSAEAGGFDGRRVRLVSEALLTELKREIGI